MIARDYQDRVVKKTLEYFNNAQFHFQGGLIVAPVGCHEKGYKVIKYDGTLEKVENIQVGDLLMGDDNTKRKVLSLFNGFDEMYKITLRNGESFTVNQHHILHLERSAGERKKDGVFVNQNPTLDIMVKDYIKLSKSVKTFYKITKRGFNINNKDHRKYSFTVENVGMGEYFGFELDGNHLYLDENFIVQHNSGKSLIAGLIAHEFGRKTIVLQPSVELLYQNSEKYAILGGEFTIYSAKAKSKEISDMTYATIGSIKSLGKEFKKQGVDTVIVDEMNLFPPKKGSMFRTFMDTLKPKYIVGLSATPCRLYNMGSMKDNYSVLNFITNQIGYDKPYFKNIIDIIQIEEIFEKYWSPIEYELYDFDESTLRLNSTGAEYTEASIQKAIKDQGINNLIFKRVKELNANGINKNLIFCDSVETAKKLANVVPNSAYVSGDLDDDERTKVIEQFKAGKIYNVFNYGVLTSGFDYPELLTVIIGRPTNSYVTIYQAMGRAVRIHPDKNKALVIDYCNNVKRFGRLEDLSIENIEGFGWGMFNGNKLLTNTKMGTLTVTKELLKGELVLDADDDDIKFWFGKHNGKKPKDCPLSYLKWFTEEFKITHNTTEEIKRLIFQAKRILEKEKSLK